MNKTRASGSRSFVASGSWSILLQATGILATTALSAILARSLGAEGFGIYSFVMSIVLLLVVPVQVGLPTLVLRETAGLLARDAGGQVRQLWSWATGVALGLTLVVGLGLVAIAELVDTTALSAPLLIIAILLVPVYVLGNLRAAALRGLGRVLIGQLPDVVLRPTLLLVLIGAALFLGRRLDPALALWLHLAAALAALVTGMVLLLRHAPPMPVGTVAPLPRRALFGATLVLGLASSLQMVGEHVNTFLLGVLGDSVEVANLRVAVSFSALAATTLNVLNMVLAPRIASLYQHGDLAEMRSLVTLSARLSFVASVIVAVALVVFGKWFIQVLFGAEFLAAYPALLVLVAGQLVNAAYGPVGILLNMCGHERHALLAIAVGLGLNLVASFLLIPLFGSLGAALAMMLSLIGWNTIMSFIVRRLIGVDSSFVGWHPKRAS